MCTPTRFDPAIAMHDCPQYRAGRAHALACMGLLDEAIQDYESAIAGDPHVSAVTVTSTVTDRLQHGAGRLQ